MEVVTLDPLTLTDLDTARAYLKAPTTEFDDAIRAMVNYASAQIEMRCKRFLLARSYDTPNAATGDRGPLLHKGTNSSTLLLREYPVNSITAITELGPDGSTTRTMNVTGLAVLDGGQVRLPMDTFYAGYQYSVKGNFGYNATAHVRERRALEAICLRWVQVMYQDRSAGIGRGTSFGVGGDIVTLIPGPMPPDVLSALWHFERPL